MTSPGIGLVCDGYHPWSALWKRNQSLFWSLATRPWVSRGLFINPAATWPSLLQGDGAQSEAQRWAWRRAAWPRRVAPRVRTWTPVAPLPFGRFGAIRDTNRVINTFLRRRLVGPHPWILMLNDPFLDEETLADLRAEAALVVFDLSDDFVAYDHADAAARAHTAERCEWLVRHADVVLAVNAMLTERYRPLNEHTYTIPNGCHYKLFAAAASPDFAVAPEMKELKGKYRGLAGYFGWMVGHRIDVGLLDELAASLPDWGFVFVGPTTPDVQDVLRRHRNVHFHDTVAHRDLPSMVAAWDVCLLPHRVNENTAGNDPLKLYEYLAAGKPVVATPVAGVERFAGLVATATTAAAFGRALADALRDRDPARQNARQAAAKAHSWTARGDAVERVLREAARRRGMSLAFPSEERQVRSRPSAQPKRIALIEPLGDPGIGTYTYELAEALTAKGVVAHVYTNGPAWTLGKLERNHRVYPVLGSALVRQRDRLRVRAASRPKGILRPPTPVPVGTGIIGNGRLRSAYLALELAIWLRSQHYDLVWTQWPTLGGYHSMFWSAARAVGLRLAHTAHNVVPREPLEGERRSYDLVYKRSHVLVVHSHQAADALAQEFPGAAHKTVVARHGLYTVFPRQPGARERIRAKLGIAPDMHVVLCFGGLRPYKNTDAVVHAVAADPAQRMLLLVAGREMSEELTPPGADALEQTRRLVVAAGLQDRARLLIGPFGFTETGELFEACDTVALPYLESFGSGLLLLAMSYGRKVVATRIGGMNEYLDDYPGGVLLNGSAPADVLAGLQAARDLPNTGLGRPSQLEWSAIVDDVLPRLF